MTTSIPLLLLLAVATVSGAASPIQEETLRLEILQAVFPTMAISVISEGGRNDPLRLFREYSTLPLPDALTSEKAYRVVGSPEGRVESCAAESVVDQSVSTIREVRFWAYSWPATSDPNSDALVVLQYEFPDSGSAGSCTSIARLVHVLRHDGQWQRRADLILDTTHHNAAPTVQLVDLDGDKIEELVVESDAGGGGMSESDLMVFSLNKSSFDQWLNVVSQRYEWVRGNKNEQYKEQFVQVFVQKLNIPRTVKDKANHFCFDKETLAVHGKRLANPRVASSCYPRFMGPKAEMELGP